MASRIKGLVVTIDGETTGLDKALKNVNGTIRETQSKLKDVERLLKLDPSNTELLSQKQKTLKESISATKEKLDALKTAQEQAKSQMESGDLGKDKYDALQREIVATEEELKRLAKEAANANETLNKIDSVGKTLENVGNKMSSTGKALTTHVTLPLAAVGAAGVKSFADVDKTMQLTNKTMGNTADEADLLNRAMKDAAANSTFGMSDAATATLNFARAGLDAEQAAAALAPSMNLAAGEGGNLDTVSAGLVATINGFHGSFNDAGKYADVFAAACNNSALDVDSLSDAMSVAAPVFSAAGYKVNDAALYMGVMANNGIDANVAANSLKTGLARLVSPAKEGAEKMAELGISVTNADGTMKDSVQIQKELHEAFGKLSESEQIAAASAIFGKNQMAPWLALINTAPGEVNELNESLENCSGTTEEMAEAMMSGFGGSLEKLKSSIDVLVTSIGEALAPTIQKVTDFIQKLVDKFNALTPAQQETIVKIGLVIAAAGPLLMMVGKLTSGIGKGLQAVSSLGKGILTFVNEAKLGVGAGGKFAAAIAAIGPAGWIIIGVVAALSAAFVYLWNTSDEFREKVTGHWEKLKSRFQEVGQKITDAINSLGFEFKDLAEVFDWLCNEVFAPLLDFLLGSVMDCIGDIIEVFGGVIEVIIGIIKGFRDGDWSMLWQGISDIAAGIINLLFEPVQWLFHLFGVELEDFDGDWGRLWTGIKEFFVNIWNAIKEFFVGIWTAIRDFFAGIWTAISATVTNVCTSIRDFFVGIWTGIRDFFAGIWDALFGTAESGSGRTEGVVTRVFGAIGTFFTNLWNGIKTFFSGIWEGLKSTASTAASAISTGVQSAWTAVSGFFTAAWSGIRIFFSGVWDGMKAAASAAYEGIRSGVSSAWNSVKETFSNVWGSIKSFFSTTWEGLKTTASNAYTSVRTGIATSWNSVKDTTSTVWANIKSGLGTTWSSISTAIGTSADGIKTKVSAAWENTKTAVSETMSNLKTSLGTAWSTISTAVSTTVGTIRTNVSTGWSNIKTSIDTAMGNIKSGIGTAWSSISTSISTTLGTMKSTISTAFSNIWTTASNTWNNIKSAMTSPVETAKTAIGNAIDRIKGLFNFTWSFPSIKMPHFSWYWQSIGGLVSIPMISVSWYKKAMDGGMILNNPTIFGMQNGQLLGAGEAGSETVVGTASLMDMIRQAVSSVESAMNIYYGGVTINVYSQPGQDISELADEIEERINMNVARRAAAFS